MDWMTLLTKEYVWIPAGLAGLLYGGAPLLIRGSVTLNTRAPVEPLTPEQLPPEAWLYFGQTAPALQACGFRVVGQLPGIGYKFGRWVDTLLMQRDLGDGMKTNP